MFCVQVLAFDLDIKDKGTVSGICDVTPPLIGRLSQ